MIKISMMSYTMAKQKESFSIEKTLKLTSELGMDGIDFVTLHDTAPEDLRRMTDDYGIPVVCHTFKANFNKDTPEERRASMDSFREGVEAAVTLGAPTIMIPTPQRRGEIPRAQSRQNWIEGFKEAISIAQDAGLTLTVENFPGAESPFVLADDVLEAINAVPGMKLTFDSGNAGTGEPPAQSFKRCAEHTVHAHFKDWYRREEPEEGYNQMLDGKYYKPALIGEGVIDHKSVIAAMKEYNYSGCINIEYEGKEYSAEEAVRRAVDYLRNLDAET